MAQLISIWQKMAHSSHFKIIVIPTSHPTAFHLSIPQQDKQLFSAEWEWAGSYSRFTPEPFRVEHLWENLEPGPPWNLPPIYLLQKLTISSAQSTSHTFFRSCCFYRRKQVTWRLHYFYDEKRALEVKYTHAYNKHAQPQPQSCIQFGEKEFPVDFFFSAPLLFDPNSARKPL